MAALSLGKKAGLATLGLAVGGAAGVIYTLDQDVKASGLNLHPPNLEWSHSKMWQSLDHLSIRRGYQVYKQVCAACHGMKVVRFRELVDVCMTLNEAKAEAAAIEVVDADPDDEGNPVIRPGGLADAFPSPYPNSKAAAHANNGAVPIDLSLITLARHGAWNHSGEDYVYHLLTSYCDPPAGMELKEGQYFNPYMYGQIIGMPPPLYNEIIEYEDGTPATKAQLAKDICTFLTWASYPSYDFQKKLGLKAVGLCFLTFLVVVYRNRCFWSSLKKQKLWVDRKPVYPKP